MIALNLVTGLAVVVYKANDGVIAVVSMAAARVAFVENNWNCRCDVVSTLGTKLTIFVSSKTNKTTYLVKFKNIIKISPSLNVFLVARELLPGILLKLRSFKYSSNRPLYSPVGSYIAAKSL